MVLGIFFVVASNLFAVFPAQSVRIAVDLVTENLNIYTFFEKSSLKPDVLQRVGVVLVYFAVLIILFALIRGFFMYLMRQYIIVVSRLIEYDLKNEVFDHYQQLSLAFYRKNNTGDLMARVSEDVGRVRMYIGPALMYFTNLVATFAVVIPAMLAVHAELTLYVLLPLPVLSYSIFYVNNIINKRSDEIQSQLSKVTSFVQETFSGMRVIKAFGAEKLFRADFEQEADEYRKRSMQLAKVDATFFPLMVFLTGLSTLITVFIGGLFAINGEITIGNIAEFVIYVNLLTWPVAALGFTSSLVQRAAASQQRINEFLQTKPDIINPSEAPFTFTSAIEFRDVSYQYPGKSDYALHHINLKLEKGTTLAILGTTGSGKSTLVQLLLRMMDVEEGQILVDGNDLKTINIKAFKQQLGYAPQDVFLFSDSIANNITFGLSGHEEHRSEKIREAAVAAALDSSIRDFPEGYETVVGERGITLSGGQKQRVSIARALIKDPDILVLDDCLSAVDTKTEAEILANFRKIFHNKTVIIISHRVSTVKDADHIIVLDNGTIVEEGEHQSLLSAGGRYASLYNSQLAEEVA